MSVTVVNTEHIVFGVTCIISTVVLVLAFIHLGQRRVRWTDHWSNRRELSVASFITASQWGTRLRPEAVELARAAFAEVFEVEPALIGPEDRWPDTFKDSPAFDQDSSDLRESLERRARALQLSVDVSGLETVEDLALKFSVAMSAATR